MKRRLNTHYLKVWELNKMKNIDIIGNTPLVTLTSASHVYAKLECYNPYGMKDRVAKHMLLKAKKAGILNSESTIIETSSGTFAQALAFVGRSMGYKVHLVVDPRIDKMTLRKLKALGVTIDIVEKMDEEGWQGARLKRVKELLAKDKNMYWTHQYDNEENKETYVSLANELLDENTSIDYLVASVGSGGSLSGTAKRIKEVYPTCKIIAVDAIGSVIFGQEHNPKRLQSGLGNGLNPLNVDFDLIDEVHWLNDSEAYSATLDLVNKEQIFAGNSSGSVYWVSRWIANNDKGKNVFCIFPDRGDRYFDTVYNPEFWQLNNLNKIDFEGLAPAEISNSNEKITNWSFKKQKRGTAS